MLGFLTTPNSARAHSAAAAEHDLAARAVPHTTAKGAGASKALTFQSFIEEEKDAASHTFPYSPSAREDTAPPLEQPPEGEGEMLDAFVETDSDFAESDDATAALEWNDTMSNFDGLEAAASDAFKAATSQTSSETSVPLSQAASQLSGDISNLSTGSAAAAAKAASAIGRHVASDQSSATRATVLNPTSTSQSTSGNVHDQAPEQRGSIEALGRMSSATTGEPISKDIAAPSKQASLMSSGIVVPVQNGAVVERAAKEATKSAHLASDMPAPPLATSRDSAQLQHAWLMTNAPTAAGIKVTAAGASLPATDIIPGDLASFAPDDTGGDVNLAAEGSTHRAGNEGRAAAFMVHHGASTARNVAAQISEAMIKAAERSIDVILNPAELGRVRITLSHSDAGMMVNVAAERADTLDMMRRHSDILGQEFTDLGYGGTDFTFAREDGASEGDRAQTSGEAALDAIPTIESGTTIVLRAASADRLDIRL